MHKIMKIVGYGLALIGIANIVKHFKHQDGCILCNLRKKMEDKKRKGSRYGSNPVKY